MLTVTAELDGNADDPMPKLVILTMCLSALALIGNLLLLG
jgi:hypothetical protein